MSEEPEKPTRDLNVGFIVKLNFLVLGLVLAIYFISTLRSDGLNKGWLATFGIGEPSISSERSARMIRPGELNWCETRVESLEQPEKMKLVQEKYKWFTNQGQKQEVDFIAVEKWFGRNCKLKVNFVSQSPGLKSSLWPVLVVGFINGPEEAFRRSDQGFFFWKGQAFLSPQLEEALAALEAFPGSDNSQ